MAILCAEQLWMLAIGLAMELAMGLALGLVMVLLLHALVWQPLPLGDLPMALIGQVTIVRLRQRNQGDLSQALANFLASLNRFLLG